MDGKADPYRAFRQLERRMPGVNRDNPQPPVPAIAPSAQPAELSARERRLAEYIVAHADDPERCVFCVHDRREHRNGAGPCMHGYDGHVVDCASDCRMYQPDTEYREPAIVTECRAVLASPEAPARAEVFVFQPRPGWWSYRIDSTRKSDGTLADAGVEFGEEESAMKRAGQVAAALGLVVRR